MKYHGHIYYDENTVDSIHKLRQEMSSLNLPTLKILPLSGKATGPHPQPMCEIHFEKEDFSFLKVWLEYRRGNHDILLHEDTQADHKDHTQGAHWLGNIVDINFGYFKT